MNRILVTGATGQIGSELVPALRRRYGSNDVIAVGHRKSPSRELQEEGPYLELDIRDRDRLRAAVRQYEVDAVFHLAALLSATAEEKPQDAWDININGLINVLEVARECGCALFHPSSIGAFGPTTPRQNTPQLTIQRPTTLYGVTKVTGELLCDYYHGRYGVDSRGVRFPGLISFRTPPGGGTTDYAVYIYYEAIRKRRHSCFLGPETRLDMMYMPDAIRAAIEVMEADASRLEYRNAYNITAMSVTPEDMARAIRRHIPDFELEFEIDPARQAIADSWPDRLDDSAAREQWGWRPEYDLEAMTADMLERLAERLG
jgi:nucleoside-diphosphate-sugar epimerase